MLYCVFSCIHFWGEKREQGRSTRVERVRKEQKKGKGGKKGGQRESRAETSEGLAEKARLLLPSVAFSLSSCLSRGFR